MPLQPQLVIESFKRWALDFVGPFHLPSNQKAYILVSTDYVTKWVETIDLPRAIEEAVINFLFGMFLWYGLPREVITNGVESTNKVIEVILTKTVSTHWRDWAAKLPEALWAYRTTWRNTTRYSLYQLVFDKEPIFPIKFEIKALRTAQEVGLDITEAQTKRLQQINELDEARLLAFQWTTIIQQQREKWHDNLIKRKTFRKGDWALLYDSRFQDFLRKLQTRWLGPYKVQEVHRNGTLTLTTIDGSGHSFKVNRH
eukprot:PITA_05030